MKVFVSYTIDGTIGVDIPENILDNPPVLSEHLNNLIEDIDGDTLVNNLIFNDTGSIVVTSVFTDLQKFSLGNPFHNSFLKKSILT